MIVRLTEADGLDLLPAGLHIADLTRPITRAEFATVSVKVYEALSGMQVEPIAENSFIDTADPEVLKALHVGITNGLSASEFGLDALFTREQAVVIAVRLVKILAAERTESSRNSAVPLRSPGVPDHFCPTGNPRGSLSGRISIAVL